jgi:hypothetical protein
MDIARDIILYEDFAIGIFGTIPAQLDFAVDRNLDIALMLHCVPPSEW